jgi:hypothetical protein
MLNLAQNTMKSRILLASLVLLSRIQAQSAPEFSFQVQCLGSMSQIDGDAAVGYSKPGFTLGVYGGYGRPQKRWDYSLGFSELGSLRGFDPDNPGLTPFHIHARQVEVGIHQSRNFARFGHPETRWSIGVEATRMLKAWESQGYMPRLQEDYRIWGAMGSIRVHHAIREHLSLAASCDYSLYSVVNNSATRWVGWGLARGGAYYNRVRFGLLLHP